MKTFEDLTPTEKDKLKTYIIYRNGMLKYLMTVITIAYIGVFIGFPLTCLPYFQLVIGGVYLMSIGVFLALVALYKLKKFQKYTQLAFGITDVMEDVFEIKKSEIKELKKTWKKVK